MMLNSFNDMDGYEEHFSLGDFDKIVAKFKLEPDFMLTVEDEKIMINEIWTHTKNKSVSANRIYEFDIFFLELIPDEIKKRVLQEVLEIYVNGERYEEAAEVRDEIQNIV
jgi:hypothetical protein